MGDVLMCPENHTLLPVNAGVAAGHTDTGPQLLFYAKLAKLEDEILAGRNPRIRLSEAFLEQLSILPILPASRAQRNDYLAQSVELPPEIHSDQQKDAVKTSDAESPRSFASANLGNNSSASPGTAVLTKPEQLEIAEIRLERQRIERLLRTGIEKQQLTTNSQRSSAWEAVDVPHTYDVSSLLDEVKSAVPHFSGVLKETLVRGNMGSSPFDDGYYSSKANSPWSSDTSKRDASVPSVCATSDIVDLESEPMDIDDQGLLDNDEDDGDEAGMEIDESNSPVVSQSNQSISSGIPYSPEPYQPHRNNNTPLSYGNNQTRQGFQLGREESYSPPSAAALGTGTGVFEETPFQRMIPKLSGVSEGGEVRFHEPSTRRQDQPMNNTRTDRSESYSPPSPEFTAGAGPSRSVRSDERGHAQAGSLTSMNHAQQSSIYQIPSNPQSIGIPTPALTMEQIQNSVRPAAQAGSGGGHQTPQTTNDSRQTRSGQYPQTQNGNTGSNKKKSKKGKRTKQSSQNTAGALPDPPRRGPSNKRATMDEFPSSQSLRPPKRLAGERRSPELYIKPEPLSPPGFTASETQGTEPRKRVVQYADGRVEIEPYHALPEVPRARRTLDSGSAPDDLVPISGGAVHSGIRPSRSLSQMGLYTDNRMLASPNSSPLVPLRRRDGGDLRRVASVQYASRPSSPTREGYWQEDADYLRATGSSTVRQGAYAIEPARPVSSQLAFQRSPISRRYVQDDLEASDMYARHAFHPPRQKIIIDDDGNEYIALLRNKAPRTPAPVLQELNYNGPGPVNEKPASHDIQSNRSRSVYERPQSSRPPPRIIEISDDEDFQLMPPPRLLPNSRVKQGDYAEPFLRRVDDFQPPSVVRAASLQPAFRAGQLPAPQQEGRRRMPIDDQRGIETATGEARFAPGQPWDTQAPSLSQFRGRASSAMPNAFGYSDHYKIGEYDPSKIRYRRY